jgi:hypothetical protein
MASLNVISPDAEDVFFGPIARLAELHRASSLSELRALLERLDRPAEACRTTTLDLIGHSTRDHHLLRLGDDRVDMLDPAVARFFRALANDGVLSRLGIAAVRLLGCETAVTAGGKRTLRMLSTAIRLPVFGATRTLAKSHYDERGFDPVFARILVEASRV